MPFLLPEVYGYCKAISLIQQRQHPPRTDSPNFTRAAESMQRRTVLKAPLAEEEGLYLHQVLAPTGLRAQVPMSC